MVIFLGVDAVKILFVNLTIRPATPDDREQTVALNLQSYASAYVCPDCGITERILREHVYDPDYNRPSFSARVIGYHAAWLQDPRARFRVACVGETIVGFAATIQLEKGVLLDGLYVHTTWQGRGIGSRLLKDVERVALPPVVLWVVKHSRSLRFYLSRGYRQLDGQTTEVKLVGGPVMHLVKLSKP